MSIIVKKAMALCIMLIVIMSMSACGKDTSMVEEIADKQDGSTVQSTTETKNKLQDSEEKSEIDMEEAETQDINDVDIDLTVLGSTMVYSEVYNMMVNPDEYLGKTIKIIGPYYASQLVYGTEKYYHFVVINDATACCQNGMEFIWDDNSHVYPDEYPENNTVIEITGVFSSYEESGDTYYYLKTDGITIK
jgi:hypothetical protein